MPGWMVAVYSISNNFIQPEASVRARELADLKRGVDIALELGTDIVRVFSGSAREGVTQEARYGLDPGGLIRRRRLC